MSLQENLTSSMALQESSKKFVTFRAVCHNTVVSRVIGSGGMMIWDLEHETQSQIVFEHHNSRCPLQVFNVTASRVPNKLFRKNEEEWDVSDAQIGILEVMDIIWSAEDEKDHDAVKAFYLLAHHNHMSSLIGQRSQNINQIRERSGASVIIKEPPPSAGKHEFLIQITGIKAAVRRGLLFLSTLLQNCEPAEKPCAEFHAGVFGMMLPDPARKVEFRFLIPHYVAGPIIGKGAVSLRALELQSAAFISVDRCRTEHQERIVTVTCFEDVGFLYSPAQNAMFLIFSRYIKAKSGYSRFRLILTAGEVSFLKMVLSEIVQYTGSNITILEDGTNPNWGQYNVLEITGECQTVENAILQVTSRLRNLQTRILPSNETKMDCASGSRTGQIQTSRMNRASFEIDGSAAASLDLLREISGADFTIYISGTALQIQAARGILHRLTNTENGN